MVDILSAATADARAFRGGGAHAVIVENFGDIPFTRGGVAPETIAAFALAGAAVREALEGSELALGFNVLRNDPLAALGLCAAVGGSFIRVNVHSGAMVTDQGIIEGDAHSTLRARQRLAPECTIFADVHVKHATPLGAGPHDIGVAAQDTVHRALADALIVSGTGTGFATGLADLASVRSACPDTPLFVGSGATAESAPRLLEYATGLIVGTAVKRDGILSNPVDPSRVAAIRKHFPDA